MLRSVQTRRLCIERVRAQSVFLRDGKSGSRLARERKITWRCDLKFGSGPPVAFKRGEKKDTCKPYTPKPQPHPAIAAILADQWQTVIG